MSAVTLDDIADDGQSHARALEALSALHALKDAKQPVGVSHIEPDTIVANVVDALAPSELAVDLHAGMLTVAREFERVRDQVGKHLPQ